MSFEEKLISAVFLRPFIYDESDKNHSKRGVIANAWKEIAKEVGSGSTDATCKSRWRNLKDTFFREKKKDIKPSGSGVDEETSSSWPWFKTMTFLSDYNVPLKTVENVDGFMDENFSQPVSLTDFEINEMIQLNEPGTDTFIRVPAGETSEGIPHSGISSGVIIPGTATRSTPAPTKSAATVDRPGKVLANGGTSKRRGKESLATQWGKVLDKFSVIDDPKDTEETTVSTFSKFVGAEMKELTPTEQDDFKWAVMESLRNIKKARK